MLPESSLSTQGRTDGGVAFALLWWVAAALIAYLAVQGSNPGYVDNQSLNEAEIEARGLLEASSALGIAADMIDDSDGEDGSRPGSSTNSRRPGSMTRQRQSGTALPATASLPGKTTEGPISQAEIASPPADSTSAADSKVSWDRRGASGGRPAGRSGGAMGQVPSSATTRDELAELGLTEEELEAAVDAELERRLGKPAPWLVEEAEEAAGPAPPPREGVPVRAQFCKVSRRYIHGFDHYCGFLGTPIGERNHCRFWLFLLCQTCAIVTAIAISHSGFRYAATATGWWGLNGGVFALCLSLYLLLAFVGGLFLLHSWLAITGSTSYELLKGPKRVWYLRHTRMCDYPFSTGILANLRRFCCTSDALCSSVYGKEWKPHRWDVPGRVVRDSEDVLEHCWENRFWSCC